MAIPTLRDQHIVVVGGTSGIGLAVAECALAEGAKVTVASSGAEPVAGAVKRLGEGASGEVVNVREEDSVAAFFEKVGALDHLVFTAGDWSRSSGLAANPVAELDFERAREGMAVRFWGALMAVKHAQGRISPAGSITLTDGLVAHRPMKGSPLSSAFGGAIEHLTRGLAVDLAPLRVNAVCPGLVLTDRIAQMMPAEMLKRYTARQPLPRGAQPEEVAQAYLYLMRGGYTTGQVLIVDGGKTIT